LLDVTEIHSILLECNKQHFHQAAATPFGGEGDGADLVDMVGFSGLTAAARAILKGIFFEEYGNNIDLLPETEQLIKELAMPEEVKALGKSSGRLQLRTSYTDSKIGKNQHQRRRQEAISATTRP
jgi:hypothetical protein